MARTAVTVAAVVAGAAALVAAQPVPLPDTTDVFLRIGSPTAQVVVEVHVDLLCPDCAAAEPVLAQVTAAYTPSQLALVYHLFPLPYHTWAFTAALGGNIIRDLAGTDSAVAAWKDYMFAGGQQNFWASAVMNYTNTQVNALFATTAANVSGVSAAAFLNELNNDANLNMDTRISWKYGCQRTVTGTPSFWVNGTLTTCSRLCWQVLAKLPPPSHTHTRAGLPVAADSTWTLADWQALLDPLFSNSSKVQQRAHLLKHHRVAA